MHAESIGNYPSRGTTSTSAQMPPCTRIHSLSLSLALGVCLESFLPTGGYQANGIRLEKLSAKPESRILNQTALHTHFQVGWLEHCGTDKGPEPEGLEFGSEPPA